MMHARWAVSRRTRIAAWLAIGGLCTIVAGLTWLPSPRQRALRHSAEVLANVAPGFGLYVDEGLCAECHPSQAASYLQTGHARTLQRAADAKLAAALDKRTFKEAERAVTFHYHFEPQAGLAVTVPERFGGDSFPLTYAFGSGRRRMTFLTLIPRQAGGTAGVEHRVSVRGGGDAPLLELTPGHQKLQPSQAVEQFGRLLDAAALDRCLECHATRGEIRDQEIQGLVPNVGCQKCHWPGREHVIAMRDAKACGVTVPARPKPSPLEEIRACARCHLQSGADDELKSMPGHVHSVRVQAAELLESRCFTRSENRLACSTCHDPHAPIAGDPASYVQRCLACHAAPQAVKCPVSPATDCVRCHMPVVTKEKGLEWHDHRIRKKPATGG